MDSESSVEDYGWGERDYRYEQPHEDDNSFLAEDDAIGYEDDSMGEDNDIIYETGQSSRGEPTEEAVTCQPNFANNGWGFDLGDDLDDEEEGDGRRGNDGPPLQAGVEIDKVWDYDQLVVMSPEFMCTLEFSSIEKVELFYKQYAQSIGFGVRLGHKRYDQDGNLRWGDMTCNKEGKRRIDIVENQNRTRMVRRETRCYCTARCCFKYVKSKGLYRLTKVVQKHSHENALGTHVHLFSCYRRLSKTDIDNFEAMRACNIRTSQAYDFMVHNKGGYMYVGFLKKDVYNTMEAERRLALIGGDIESTIKYMRDKRHEDRGHQCIVGVNEEGRLGNLIWRDSKCLDDYMRFHDTVQFDSTYKTNIYGRPLVLFVGANHHRKSILFGFALLQDERTETYVCVLKHFLQLMKGVAPLSVLTDGDEAMHNAVVQVFPLARHRLCCWHVGRNFRQHIKEKNIRKQFLDLLHKPMSLDLWETKWAGAVSALQESAVSETVMKWVDSMYRKKDRWAEAYFFGQFFAMMTSTQRVEGLHRHLKTGLSRVSRIYELPIHVASCLVRMREEVLADDYGTINSTPVPTTFMEKAEAKLANRLTNTMYLVARNQIDKISKYNVSYFEDDPESGCMYWTVWQSFRNDVEWGVEFAEGIFRCSCGLFEADGIPCAHIYTCMKNQNIEELPDRMIKSRWTTVRRAAEVAAAGLNSTGIERKKYVRCYALNQIASSICSDASLSVAGYMHVLQELSKLKESMKDYSIPDTDDDEAEVNVEDCENVVLDPLPHLSRNANANVNAHEDEVIATRAPPKCSYCNETGHNITSCRIRLVDEATRVNARADHSRRRNRNDSTDSPRHEQQSSRPRRH